MNPAAFGGRIADTMLTNSSALTLRIILKRGGPAMRELALAFFLVSVTAILAGFYLFPAIISELDQLRQGDVPVPVMVMFLSTWGAASIIVALAGILIQFKTLLRSPQGRTSSPPASVPEERKTLYPPEVSAVAVAAARRRCRRGTLRVVATNTVPASPAANDMQPVFATRRAGERA